MGNVLVKVKILNRIHLLPSRRLVVSLSIVEVIITAVLILQDPLSTLFETNQVYDLVIRQSFTHNIHLQIISLPVLTSYLVKYARVQPSSFTHTRTCPHKQTSLSPFLLTETWFSTTFSKERKNTKKKKLKI